MKIYHTETQEDYDALMVELEEQGCKWLSGRKPTEATINWKMNSSETCVEVDKKAIVYAEKSFYTFRHPNISITKYKAKAEEKMRLTKENVYKIVARYRLDFDYLIDDLRSDISKLEYTPEKVVVPEFVAEWIELCKEKANLTDCLQGSYHHYNGSEIIKEDEDWLFEGNNQDVVARAWLDGYEVEKEQLYHVKFPNITNCGFSMFLFKDLDGKIKIADENANHERMRFTEAEIKAIDERYWAFAVPVGDKHENNE